MKEIISKIVVVIVVAAIICGIMISWYVIETKSDCRKYERINSNIEFNWSFETACEFQLPDGTWFSILEYENQKEFEIEIE